MNKEKEGCETCPAVFSSESGHYIQVTRFLYPQIADEIKKDQPILSEFISGRFLLSNKPYVYLEGVALAYLSVRDELRLRNLHPLRAVVTSDGIDLYRHQLNRWELSDPRTLVGQVNYYIPTLLDVSRHRAEELGYHTPEDFPVFTQGTLDACLPYIYSIDDTFWHS